MKNPARFFRLSFSLHLSFFLFLFLISNAFALTWARTYANPSGDLTGARYMPSAESLSGDGYYFAAEAKLFKIRNDGSLAWVKDYGSNLSGSGSL